MALSLHSTVISAWEYVTARFSSYLPYKYIQIWYQIQACFGFACYVGFHCWAEQDKEKNSDAESHSSAPNQDSASMPCQPTAEELVLGFRLHLMHQQRQSQQPLGSNGPFCKPMPNIQDFLEQRKTGNFLQQVLLFNCH
jgi:hypothetical protein